MDNINLSRSRSPSRERFSRPMRYRDGREDPRPCRLVQSAPEHCCLEGNACTFLHWALFWFAQVHRLKLHELTTLIGFPALIILNGSFQVHWNIWNECWHFWEGSWEYFPGIRGDRLCTLPVYSPFAWTTAYLLIKSGNVSDKNCTRSYNGKKPRVRFRLLPQDAGCSCGTSNTLLRLCM